MPTNKKWLRPGKKRGVKKIRRRTHETSRDGWIATAIACIYLPNCNKINERLDFKNQSWEKLKTALQDDRFYFDLTKQRYARALVEIDGKVIFVI